jgi:PAP2 superfamily
VRSPGIATGVPAAFARASVRLLLLFGVLFYGVDALTAQRQLRVPLHMGWELALPYWPPAFVVYFSVLAVPFLPLWLSPDAAHLQRWERRMALAVVLAAAVFLLLPAAPAYPPADARAWPAWEGWARLAALVAGQHNMLPSLHVALSGLTMLCVWSEAGPRGRVVLATWFVGLVASVLLTHQHHVADVVAGALLALALRPR